MQQVGVGRREAGEVGRPGPPKALTLAEEFDQPHRVTLAKSPTSLAQLHMYDFPR